MVFANHIRFVEQFFGPCKESVQQVITLLIIENNLVDRGSKFRTDWGEFFRQLDR